MFSLCSAKPTRQEGSLVLLNGVSLATVSDALRERVPNQLLKRLHPNMLYMPGSTIPMKSEYPNVTQRMVKLIEKSQHLAAAGHTVCLELDDPLRSTTGLARRMLQRSPTQITSVLGYTPMSRLAQGPAQQAALNLIGFGLHFKGAQAGPGVDYLSRKEFDGAMTTLKKAFGASHDAQVKTLIVSQFLSSALGLHGNAKGVYLHPRSAYDVVVNVSQPAKAAKQLWSHISATSSGVTASKLFSSTPLQANFGCRACKKPFSRGLCGACLHNLHHILNGSNFVRVNPLPNRPHQAAGQDQAPATAGLIGSSGVDNAQVNAPTSLWVPVAHGLVSPYDVDTTAYPTLEAAQAASAALAFRSDGVVEREGQFFVVGPYAQVIMEDNTSKGYLKLQSPAGGCGLDLITVRQIWNDLTDNGQVNEVSIDRLAPYFMSKYQIPANIVHVVINTADLNGNGRLDQEEFQKFLCSAAFDATLGRFADNIRQTQRRTQQTNYASHNQATAQFRNAPENNYVIGSDPIGSHSDSGFNVGVDQSTIQAGAIDGVESPALAAYGENQLAAHSEEEEDGAWKPQVPEELNSNAWQKDVIIPRELSEFGPGSITNEYNKWEWPNGTQDIPADTRFFCSSVFPIEEEVANWNYEVEDPFAKGDSFLSQGLDVLRALQAAATAQQEADHEARKKLYTAAP